MNYFLKIFVLVFSLAFASIKPLTGWSAETTAEELASTPWQEIVAYASENLPLEGVLRIKQDGFAYIKVDDAYIHDLFPLLELSREGFKEPPYFRSKEAPGAHISVFYEDEDILPSEIGETFHFTLKKIVIVRTRDARYAVLQVDAPELEQLRQKYGLSRKLHGHEFHISLAKQKMARH